MITVNPAVFDTISKAFYSINKKDTRECLKYVEISKLDENSAVVTSANGIIAFRKKIFDEGFMGIMNNSKKDKLYIHVDQWPSIKLIAKSKCAIESSYDDNSHKLNTNISNIQFSDCSAYPDVKKAIQSLKDDELSSITFNMKQLESLCKSLHRESTKTQIITLTVPKNEGKAITVTSDSDDKEMGVIMPIPQKKEVK